MNLIVKTDHPYVVKNKEICGGRPTIKGTRTPVQSIVWFYKEGLDPDEIVKNLPHLSLSQIYDALSYYHDHKKQIENDLKETQMKNVAKKMRLKADKRGFITGK